MQASADLLGPDLTRIWLLDDGGQTISLAAAAYGHHGMPPDITAARQRMPVDGTIVGRVASTRRPHYSPTMEADSQAEHREWIRAQGLRSQLVVPLVAGDRAIGALEIVYRVVHEPSQDDVELLEALAAQAANAIHNATGVRIRDYPITLDKLLKELPKPA